MVADLVIITALVFSTVIGYRNGLIRTLFKFVGFVAGGVLGIYLSLKFSHDWSLDIKRIGFVIASIVGGGYLCYRRRTCQGSTSYHFSRPNRFLRFSHWRTSRNRAHGNRALLDRNCSALVTMAGSAKSDHR